MIYVRYEAARQNSRGTFPGVFALANGLAHSGALSSDDWRWWRESNDWYDAAYLDPESVDPTVFDRERNPLAACWFKASAEELLARVPGYLALLDRYDVAWVERRSADPGRIVYEDDLQVVVVPHIDVRDH